MKLLIRLGWNLIGKKQTIGLRSSHVLLLLLRSRIKRYAKFFGPNVQAKVLKVNAEERLVAIELTTCTPEEYEQYLQQPDNNIGSTNNTQIAPVGENSTGKDQ